MAQSTNSANKIEKTVNRPVQTIRYGCVRAAIWQNIVDNGNSSRPVYNVTFSRSYKDGKEWKDSSSFGPDDLLVLAKAMNDAHTFIYRRRMNDGDGSSGEA